MSRAEAVFDAFSGRGLASQLIKHVLDDARVRGLRVVPRCPLVAAYIERMSAYLTLYPGDVIWMGCDGHTLPSLQPGDLVEVVNEAIGVLANRVTRAS